VFGVRKKRGFGGKGYRDCGERGEPQPESLAERGIPPPPPPPNRAS